MGRRKLDHDDDDDLLVETGGAVYVQQWQTGETPAKVQDVLDALDMKDVPADVCDYFQRIVYREDKYGWGSGREKIILLVRTITESQGNGGALVECGWLVHEARMDTSRTCLDRGIRLGEPLRRCAASISSTSARCRTT